MDKNLSVNTYNKIAEVYTEKYFNDNSDLPFIDKWIKSLPNNARVLDVGCGPSHLSKYLIDKGCIVEGIDLSDEMISIARRKVPEVKFEIMDMRKLLYGNNTFDGILAAYSLIHIPSCEVETVLKEFYRVLSVGGTALFIVQKGDADRIVNEPFKPSEKMF